MSILIDLALRHRIHILPIGVGCAIYINNRLTIIFIAPIYFGVLIYYGINLFVMAVY